jgi:hypothetical protein
MPINLQAGGTAYFTPAAQLSRMVRANVAVASVARDPYWEQVFGGLDGQDVGLGYGPLSATQNVYALFQSNLYNETYALYQLDTPGSLPNGNIGANVNYPAFRLYHDQYSALYAWRSVGYSNFNALEAVYRQRFGGGLQADLNYTYSKSLDITSQAEPLGNSGGINYAQIMNTWEPNQLYGPSDYEFGTRSIALLSGICRLVRKEILLWCGSSHKRTHWRVADDRHRPLDKRLPFRDEQWRLLPNERGYSRLCPTGFEDSLAGRGSRAFDAEVC